MYDLDPKTLDMPVSEVVINFFYLRLRLLYQPDLDHKSLDALQVLSI